jgi:hypothetical protein
MTNESIHAFCDWLSQTKLSQTIQNVTIIIPMVQSVHIACISLVIGAAGMANLRVFNLGMRSQSTSTLAARLFPLVWWSLPVLLATGVVLIIGEPVRSLENPTFQIKMALLVCGMVTTFLFQKTIGHDVAFWDLPAQKRTQAKILAALSLIIWICIIFAGRYIAYTITDYD